MSQTSDCDSSFYAYNDRGEQFSIDTDSSFELTELVDVPRCASSDESSTDRKSGHGDANDARSEESHRVSDKRRKGKSKPVIRTQKGKLSVKDFSVVHFLGMGAAGKVYLVKPKLGEDQQFFAMKVLSKEEMVAMNKVQRVMTEREILSSSDHPFIVTLYYCFQSTKKLIFIMEYCAGGEFYRVIQRQPFKCLTGLVFFFCF